MNYICSKCYYVYCNKRVASLLISATRGSNTTVLFAREYSQQASYVVTVSAWSLEIFNVAELRPHSVHIYYMFELKLRCGTICAHTHTQRREYNSYSYMHTHAYMCDSIKSLHEHDYIWPELLYMILCVYVT